MNKKSQRTMLELWPVLQEDFKKYTADRPGWLIDALQQALDKKGTGGWRDIETIIAILQFLKDAEVEYY